MSDRTANAFTEDRIEHRSESKRLPVAIGDERQSKADNDINAPAVQTPVQKRDVHGERRRRGRARRAGRRIGVMRDRLGNGPEQHTNPHAGAKQHREPREVAIPWPLVFAAQTDAAIPADAKPKTKEQARPSLQ